MNFQPRIFLEISVLSAYHTLQSSNVFLKGFLTAFISVNYLLAFKPGLILEVLQRSVMLLASESHLQLACFFSKCNKNESNFRSI